LQSEVKRLIDALQLSEHPEGGWYRETYRSPEKTETTKGTRNLATLIHYLLPRGVSSRIHRVSWDEVWLWQGGGVLDVRSHEGDEYTSHLLGLPGGALKEPAAALQVNVQLLMPAHTWFNATVIEGDYVLAACMVAPGFEFADLEMR
jgi:uncharacterized protein